MGKGGIGMGREGPVYVCQFLSGMFEPSGDLLGDKGGLYDILSVYRLTLTMVPL